MTLTEFLTARLDEDEAVAKLCVTEQWAVKDGWHSGLDMEVLSPTYPACIEVEEAMHTARHDPARVLAEVEAKRRIVRLHDFTQWNVPVGDDYPGGVRRACMMCGNYDERPIVDWPCPTLCLMALPHANHPDYDGAWRP